MDKSKIVALILEQLRDAFGARHAASRQTRSAGNDEQSKAENKYDTLSIEQNYLADGLARQAQAAVQAAAAYEKLPPRDFAADEAIDLGALVELEFPDGREWFFIGPAGGGIEIRHEETLITVLTPEAPLGAQLLDRRAGESIARPKATIRSVG
jgi:hypothetical protein